MRFDILTIFPEAFESYLNTSILKRAQERGLISVKLHGLRKWGKGKHKQLDDKPYGGGPGMVLKIEPLARAIGSILKAKAKSKKEKVLAVLFSAAGKQFSSAMASAWAKKYERLVLISGRYEGVDERVKKIVSDFGIRISDLSVGPYVLTGGELPAMAVIDAVSRHIPGVLGKTESLEEKRHGAGVPMYTRPEVFSWRGKKYRVPKVLLSGDHKKIEEWRRKRKIFNLSRKSLRPEPLSCKPFRLIV